MNFDHTVEGLRLRDEIEAMLLAQHRKATPRSRAGGLTPLIRNGSRTRQRGCVLCGWIGPTWCARYDETMFAYRAAKGHRAQHVEGAIAMLRSSASRKLCSRALPPVRAVQSATGPATCEGGL